MMTYQKNANGLTKPFNARLKTALCLTIMLALLAPARLFADELSRNSMECFRWAMECDALLVKGDQFRAILALYEQDFKEELRKKKEHNPAEYLANIANYDFIVSPGNGRYEIGVGATMRPGHPDYFGGTNYTLKAKTFKLIEKRGYK